MARQLLRASPPATVLVADNFMFASELAFQLDGRRPVYVLDNPLNVKHGRSPQLRVWQRDGASLRAAHAGAPMLLAVEESALPERLQPSVLGATCRRIRHARLAGALAIDHGRKRMAFYRGTVPGHLLARVPRDACLVWRHAFSTRETARR
jgi:hypothetical protein